MLFEFAELSHEGFGKLWKAMGVMHAIDKDYKVWVAFSVTSRIRRIDFAGKRKSCANKMLDNKSDQMQCVETR